MPTFTVDITQLRSAADQVGRAARAADALADHPGVVRGRAADSGSDDLRDAAEELAGRWERSFRCLAADTRHLAAAIGLVLTTYESVELQVGAALGGVADRLDGAA